MRMRAWCGERRDIVGCMWGCLLGGLGGGGQEKGTGVIASVLAADNGYWV